ncbi:response regulator [Ferruginibacter lapsinanis]|uniref:response regulator n=1 Tax=Ferruginibacter lapsinanis TaxID=563172 RepID=UPI001E57C355|nr:response regulator [Ferruginibacter lapsinanis]UEG48854.1 response regulator [Ferruginibacter lapsinanis]
MKKILLIEDNDNIRESTAEILEMTQYDVITAENGKIGVELALKEKPDLIICDIMMPLLDGYGVLHMLQKNDATKNVPFIFLTAKADRSDFRKGMEGGADDYVTKPFNVTELLSAVEIRLKKAAQIKSELTENVDGVVVKPNENKKYDSLEELISGRNIVKYKKKQLVFLEGSRPNSLFYVQKGKVKTYKTNEDGKGLVVGLYNEGDFLGHLALFENTNYHETAEAMEATELAVIPREDFEEILESNHEVIRKFTQLLAKNISEKEIQLLGLAYNSLRRKVADALVALNKKYNATEKENFSIGISRDNLAAIAGTATESLIRTLGDFKNEKLIDIVNGSIIILNEKKLERIIN